MCAKRLSRLRFACLFLAALSLPAVCWAAEPPTLTISQLLQTADERLTRLETRLAERKQDTLTLQADLMQLSAELTQARALLAESQTDLTETRSLLDSLTMRYDKLLSDYQSSMRRVTRNERTWRIVACVSLGAVAGALADEWRGALYGAGAGALGAGAWELWQWVRR